MQLGQIFSVTKDKVVAFTKIKVQDFPIKGKDMAATMEKVVKSSFPKATLVSNRFHVQKLAYDAVQEKALAFTKLAQWYDKVEKAGYKFNTVSRSIQAHYLTILNYFYNRSTNAWQNPLMLRSKLSDLLLEE